MADNRFMSAPACPACSCPSRTLLGYLPGRAYAFGRVKIPFPESGIRLYQCEQCSLVYKGDLPPKECLAGIIKREARYHWLNAQTPDTIAQELANLFGANYDLIDVGAWSGGLLAACSAAGGRRSAIDVVQHPDLAGILRGEFVRGFIEDRGLAFSGETYDVVTMFDVAEHLYEPTAAFGNVCQLLRPGGVVVIETGNSDVFKGCREKLATWWYIRLFEHHMVWNQQSFQAMAERHGLHVERIDPVQHKAHGGSWAARAWRLFRAGLCWNGHRVWTSKTSLLWLKRKAWVGSDGRDHLRVVLRRP